MTRHSFCKNIDLDDLSQLTFGLLKQEIARRKKELVTEHWNGIKPCLDTSKWIIRSDPMGHITILVPAQLV